MEDQRASKCYKRGLNQGSLTQKHTFTHRKNIYNEDLLKFTDAETETQVKCLAKVMQVLSEKLRHEYETSASKLVYYSRQSLL